MRGSAKNRMQQNIKTYSKLHIHIEGNHLKRLLNCSSIPAVEYKVFQSENLFPATSEGTKKINMEIYH